MTKLCMGKLQLKSRCHVWCIGTCNVMEYCYIVDNCFVVYGYELFNIIKIFMESESSSHI